MGHMGARPRSPRRGAAMTHSSGSTFTPPPPPLPPPSPDGASPWGSQGKLKRKEIAKKFYIDRYILFLLPPPPPFFSGWRWAGDPRMWLCRGAVVPPSIPAALSFGGAATSTAAHPCPCATHVHAPSVPLCHISECHSCLWCHMSQCHPCWRDTSRDTPSPSVSLLWAGSRLEALPFVSLAALYIALPETFGQV